MKPTTTEESERAELREYLPWYVNGTLDADRGDALHDLIGSDLQTRREWRETRALAAFVAAEDTLAPVVRPIAVPVARGDTGREWRWLAVAALVPLIVGLTLLVVWMSAPRYATLSAPVPPALEPSSQVRLRLHLAEALPAGELDAALRPYGGSLVAGPSAPGLYTVALPADRQEAAERMLRERYAPLYLGVAEY